MIFFKYILGKAYKYITINRVSQSPLQYLKLLKVIVTGIPKQMEYMEELVH